MENGAEFRDPDLVHYEQKSFNKQMKRYCRFMDMYAQPITLRYKNEKRFYTNFGAATSCLVMFALLSIFLTEFVEMFSDTQILMSSNEQFYTYRPQLDSKPNF